MDNRLIGIPKRFLKVRLLANECMDIGKNWEPLYRRDEGKYRIEIWDTKQT